MPGQTCYMEHAAGGSAGSDHGQSYYQLSNKLRAKSYRSIRRYNITMIYEHIFSNLEYRLQAETISHPENVLCFLRCGTEEF